VTSKKIRSQSCVSGPTGLDVAVKIGDLELGALQKLSGDFDFARI
jgi:hypothetical protein